MDISWLILTETAGLSFSGEAVDIRWAGVNSLEGDIT